MEAMYDEEPPNNDIVFLRELHSIFPIPQEIQGSFIKFVAFYLANGGQGAPLKELWRSASQQGALLPVARFARDFLIERGASSDDQISFWNTIIQSIEQNPQNAFQFFPAPDISQFPSWLASFLGENNNKIHDLLADAKA
jgi:hypothetical protein